jgi:ABC-type nitrate/sulfonate/bicarbonate transport system substrate-binding protein
MKLSTLPPANLLAALEKNDVAGATLYEPYLSQALKTGNYRILYRTADVYKQHYKRDLVALSWGARKDFYQKNPEATRKFVEVLERAYKEIHVNIDAAAEITSKEIPELKMTGAQIKEIVLPYMDSYIRTQNTPEFIAEVQQFYDELLEIKQLNKPVKAADFWIKP